MAAEAVTSMTHREQPFSIAKNRQNSSPMTTSSTSSLAIDKNKALSESIQCSSDEIGLRMSAAMAIETNRMKTPTPPPPMAASVAGVVDRRAIADYVASQVARQQATLSPGSIGGAAGPLSPGSIGGMAGPSSPGSILSGAAMPLSPGRIGRTAAQPFGGRATMARRVASMSSFASQHRHPSANFAAAGPLPAPSRPNAVMEVLQQKMAARQELEQAELQRRLAQQQLDAAVQVKAAADLQRRGEMLELMERQQFMHEQMAEQIRLKMIAQVQKRQEEKVRKAREASDASAAALAVLAGSMAPSPAGATAMPSREAATAPFAVPPHRSLSLAELTSRARTAEGLFATAGAASPTLNLHRPGQAKTERTRFPSALDLKLKKNKKKGSRVMRRQSSCGEDLSTPPVIVGGNGELCPSSSQQQLNSANDYRRRRSYGDISVASDLSCDTTASASLNSASHATTDHGGESDTRSSHESSKLRRASELDAQSIRRSMSGARLGSRGSFGSLRRASTTNRGSLTSLASVSELGQHMPEITPKNGGKNQTFDTIASHLPDRIKYDSVSDQLAVKPLDVVKLALKERGMDATIKPSLSMPENFFLRNTEEHVSSYGQDVVDAIRNEDVDALRSFHDSGRNLQCCNKFGESLIHMACRRGFFAVVDYLLNGGPEVSLRVRDDYGRTPLHDACWTASPNLDLMKMLLEREPSLLLLKDKRGHTPLDYARREHWGVWVKFLGENADLLRPLEEST